MHMVGQAKIVRIDALLPTSIRIVRLIELGWGTADTHFCPSVRVTAIVVYGHCSYYGIVTCHGQFLLSYLAYV